METPVSATRSGSMRYSDCTCFRIARARLPPADSGVQFSSSRACGKITRNGKSSFFSRMAFARPLKGLTSAVGASPPGSVQVQDRRYGLIAGVVRRYEHDVLRLGAVCLAKDLVAKARVGRG